MEKDYPLSTFCQETDSACCNVQTLPSPPITPKKRRYLTYSELLASFSPRSQPLPKSPNQFPETSGLRGDEHTRGRRGAEKSSDIWPLVESDQRNFISEAIDIDLREENKSNHSLIFHFIIIHLLTKHRTKERL